MEPEYWGKIKEIQPKLRIQVYQDDSHHSDLSRVYVLDMKPIRSLLEQAGVKETVILRFKRYKLGKYDPVIETKEGKEVVKFSSIPDKKSIEVSRPRHIGRNMSSEARMSSRDNFWLSKRMELQIRNGRKKIKERIKVYFKFVF